MTVAISNRLFNMPNTDPKAKRPDLHDIADTRDLDLQVAARLADRADDMDDSGFDPSPESIEEWKWFNFFAN